MFTVTYVYDYLVLCNLVITVCFNPLNYTTSEQEGPLTIAMMLSNPSSSQITFQTAANDGTAVGKVWLVEVYMNIS